MESYETLRRVGRGHHATVWYARLAAAGVRREPAPSASAAPRRIRATVLVTQRAVLRGQRVDGPVSVQRRARERAASRSVRLPAGTARLLAPHAHVGRAGASLAPNQHAGACALAHHAALRPCPCPCARALPATAGAL